MKFMQYFFNLVKEIISLLKVSKESRNKEVELKNQEDFKNRQVKQQEVQEKDKNEVLIDQVVNAKTKEDREKSLEEIRKIVSR